MLDALIYMKNKENIKFYRLIRKINIRWKTKENVKLDCTRDT